MTTVAQNHQPQRKRVSAARIKGRAVAPALFALAAACGSVYDEFRPEVEIPDLAELVLADVERPTVVERIRVDRDMTVAVQRPVDVTSNRVVVLLHGVLSDRRVWRFVAGDLGADHDVIRIDLPGCGGSDKPDPDVVGDELYKPDSMARMVWAALRPTIAKYDSSPRITLVGHSLGGLVVLRMLANPDLRASFSDVLARIDGAVLLAPLDVRVIRRYPDFERIATLGTAMAEVGEMLGLIERECAQQTHDSTLTPWRMPREEVDRLCEILGDGATRRAAQAMLRQAASFLPDGRPDFERIAVLEAEYDNINEPCVVVFGERDVCLNPNMGFKLVGSLPRAWLRLLPSCGHARPAERPRICAAITRQLAMAERPTLARRVVRLNDELPEHASAGRLREADAVSGRTVASK